MSNILKEILNRGIISCSIFSKSWGAVLWIILLSAGISFETHSKNYYVNSKIGNDKFNGLTPLRPKLTIQAAAELTKPGDTVYVMNGEYTNDCPSCNVVEVPSSGTRTAYIVYTNYPKHRPVLKFNGWAGFMIKGQSFIKISGFEVVGNNSKVSLARALKQPGSCSNKNKTPDPRYNGNGIAILGKSHHIIISKNIVKECGGGGIGASQSDYITIEDNLVYNNSWYTIYGTSGISLYQFWNSDKSSGYHNFIRRNRSFNNKNLVPWPQNCKVNDGNGIIVDDFRNLQNGSKLGKYNARTLIENNITWFNGGTGIHAFQSDHIDIINNTAYRNSQSAGLDAGQILSGAGSDNKIINNILVSDKQKPLNSNYLNSGLVYENNLHYNVSNPGNERIAVNSFTSISGSNPLFLKPGISLSADFRLNSKSPAIDRGNSIWFSKTDFYNRKRPAGKRADIGAIEYR